MRIQTSQEKAEFEVWASTVKEQMLQALQKTRMKQAAKSLTERGAQDSASERG